MPGREFPGLLQGEQGGWDVLKAAFSLIDQVFLETIWPFSQYCLLENFTLISWLSPPSRLRELLGHSVMPRGCRAATVAA